MQTNRRKICVDALLKLQMSDPKWINLNSQRLKKKFGKWRAIVNRVDIRMANLHKLNKWLGKGEEVDPAEMLKSSADVDKDDCNFEYHEPSVREG